jgi:hypothetical protein
MVKAMGSSHEIVLLLRVQRGEGKLEGFERGAAGLLENGNQRVLQLAAGAS